MKRTLCALALAGLASPALAQDLTVGFVDAQGAANGVARLVETEVGVLISIELQGLPPGEWLAFHVHEHGHCDAHGRHQSAGGHFNPLGAEHGFLSQDGPHAGDMPNIHVGADGEVRAEVLNTFVTLREGETSILGRSLMIHAGHDDHLSQPSGDAGERLACAVID